MGGFKFEVEGIKYLKQEEKEQVQCICRIEISLESLGENVVEEKGRVRDLNVIVVFIKDLGSYFGYLKY